MKLIARLSLAPLLLACGAPPKAVVRPTQAQAAQCRRTLGDMGGRVKALRAERAQVMANRARLPAGYDHGSIDATLAQIQREIDLRLQSLPGMRARCAEMEAGL